MTLHLVLRLLLLMILQLCPLPSHLPSPSVTLPACSLEARPPLCQLLYYTAALFKVLDWKIKNVFFVCVCLFIIYYLREKYYKPSTVQYCVADCVNWVLRLSLLDLGRDWTSIPRALSRCLLTGFLSHIRICDKGEGVGEKRLFTYRDDTPVTPWGRVAKRRSPPQ